MQPRRWRNFDAIRLGAAITVIFSHSFLLSATGYHAEPFAQLFGLGHDLGLMAVGTFFIISGFLITQSFQRRVSVPAYLVNRVARIFPGLIVATLLTAFVIGPFFAGNVLEYVMSAKTWDYVRTTILLQADGGKVFPVSLYPSPYGAQMLGTSWSLSPEFVCYIGVLIFGVFGLLRLPAALACLALGLWTHSQWTAPVLGGTAWTMMFFAAGSALWFVHQRGRPGRAAMAVAAAGTILTAIAGYPTEALAVFGSVLIIQLATSSSVRLPDAARYGDLSYGVYLYGWPAQQLVRVALGPSVTWWQMLALALPLALVCGWLSWRLIEAPSLRLAHRYGASVAARPAPGAALNPASAR